jgi:hypothetical protein
MTRPSTCCGASADGCVCAAQARCECGKTAAGDCNCDKAFQKTSGPRCSCRKLRCQAHTYTVETDFPTSLGMRPAGQCTCERSVTENRPVGSEACPCGQRPAGKFEPCLPGTFWFPEESSDGPVALRWYVVTLMFVVAAI